MDNTIHGYLVADYDDEISHSIDTSFINLREWMLEKINPGGEYPVAGGTFSGERLSPVVGVDRVFYEADLLQHIGRILGMCVEHLLQ